MQVETLFIFLVKRKAYESYFINNIFVEFLRILFIHVLRLTINDFVITKHPTPRLVCGGVSGKSLSDIPVGALCAEKSNILTK